MYFGIGHKGSNIHRYDLVRKSYKRLMRSARLLGERLPIGIEPQIPSTPLLPRDSIPVGGSMGRIAPIGVGGGTVRFGLVAVVEPGSTNELINQFI